MTRLCWSRGCRDRLKLTKRQKVAEAVGAGVPYWQFAAVLRLFPLLEKLVFTHKSSAGHGHLMTDLLEGRLPSLVKEGSPC